MKDEHGINRRYKFGYDRRFHNNMARVKAMDALKRCVDLRGAVAVILVYLEEMGQEDIAELLRTFL